MHIYTYKYLRTYLSQWSHLHMVFIGLLSTVVPKRCPQPTYDTDFFHLQRLTSFTHMETNLMRINSARNINDRCPHAIPLIPFIGQVACNILSIGPFDRVVCSNFVGDEMDDRWLSIDWLARATRPTRIDHIPKARRHNRTSVFIPRP